MQPPKITQLFDIKFYRLTKVKHNEDLTSRAIENSEKSLTKDIWFVYSSTISQNEITKLESQKKYCKVQDTYYEYSSSFG